MLATQALRSNKHDVCLKTLDLSRENSNHFVVERVVINGVEWLIPSTHTTQLFHYQLFCKKPTKDLQEVLSGYLYAGLSFISS